jgi:hypothetical protein
MIASDQTLRNFDPLRFCRAPGLRDQERHALIAKAAYFRAERRAFRAGHELEDWLAAEAEVDQQLRLVATRALRR